MFCCCCSVAKLCLTLATLRTAAHQASLSFTISWSLLKSMSIELTMLSNHLILCLPASPFALHLSQHQGLSQSLVCIRWLKYWSLSFNISPFNKYTQFISFRIQWFWSPCCPSDSQESSPALQFKSINSSVLSLLYGPTLISIHDCWKDYNLDYTDFCRQSD